MLRRLNYVYTLQYYKYIVQTTHILDSTGVNNLNGGGENAPLTHAGYFRSFKTFLENSGE